LTIQRELVLLDRLSQARHGIGPPGEPGIHPVRELVVHAEILSKIDKGDWAIRMASEFFHVEQLTKRFGGLTAVNAVSFELKRDELVGLIGPNGAGKTTLLDRKST